MQGKTSKLSTSGKVGCYRVTTKERIQVPARSEMVIEGKVKLHGKECKSFGLVECFGNPGDSSKGLVARTLLRARSTVPVRLMNVESEPLLIQPGSHIAGLSLVSYVAPVNGAKRGDNKIIPNVPVHMKDLYERAVCGMSPDNGLLAF